MKILVITGSPHKNGTSALLTEQFIKGAGEAGHDVFRFDTAFKKVNYCIACERCQNTDKGCIFQDDMQELNLLLLTTDAVVFVSPIYYYGMTAQIKTVIDRFHANKAALHKLIKAALLITCEDNTLESAEGAIVSFKGIISYLGWENIGIITATNCLNVEDIKDSSFPKAAYDLGKCI